MKNNSVDILLDALRQIAGASPSESPLALGEIASDALLRFATSSAPSQSGYSPTNRKVDPLNRATSFLP